MSYSEIEPEKKKVTGEKPGKKWGRSEYIFDSKGNKIKDPMVHAIEKGFEFKPVPSVRKSDSSKKGESKNGR